MRYFYINVFIGITTNFKLDTSTFYSWNPNLNCNNLQVGQIICVNGPVATIATTAAPVTVKAGCPRTYTVKSGDTCSNLWNYYKIDQNSFTAWNPSINCNNLQIGQLICIPNSNTCANPYTIRSGDYCYSIYTSKGMTSDRFYSLNPGIDCANLQVGQIVCV